MKRFLLFAGDTYYPSGGWRDFQGDYESVEDAFRSLARKRSSFEWYQVVDWKTREIVDAGARSDP
jgi:hypothetical protein